MPTTDYNARANTKKTAPKKKPLIWITFMLGFVSGGFVSSLLFLSTPDFKPKLVDMGEATAETKDETVKVDKTEQPPKPEFKFYSMLAEMEVPATEKIPPLAVTQKKWTPPMVVKPKAESIVNNPPQKNNHKNKDPMYLLQLGSFKQVKDAERTKVRLALMSVQTAVHRFVGKNNQVYYRVRTMASQDKSTLNRLRQRLKKSHIDSFFIRVK